MIFHKKIRLKLIVGFLVGVLSIGLFAVYSHNVFDKAKSTIDEQATILKYTQSMALHIKESFNVLNTYLFVTNSTDLEILKSEYAVSTYNANKYLSDLKDSGIDLVVLEQLQEYSEKNDDILQDMIYVHDLELIEENASVLKDLETQEKALLLDSHETQEEVQAIINTIIEDASLNFDNAIYEYDRVRKNTKIFLFIIIAYSAGLAIVIANSLGKPILYLRDMANEVGKGNLDVKIEAKSSDELGELTNEFNRMVINLKKTEKVIKDKNKKLAESNRLKDMFMDIMRHDIFNPLTVIKGFTEDLLEKNKSMETESILTSVDEIIAIVENAKKYALIESSSLPKSQTDLRNVINKLCKEILPSFKKAGVELINNIKIDMPIKANPLIEEVFLNFLTNALKYAPEGKKIIIEGEKVDGSYILRIIDFGQGVPDKYKKSIFTRFMRREQEGVKGTGLGLAIVKKLVELHSGEVWVEDNPKGGAVFVVRLPSLQ